jgi:sulfane dehydrogenase subunit SoxC
MDDAKLRDEIAAGNGLLHRRTMLRGGLVTAGTAGLVLAGTEKIGDNLPEWMRKPGRDFSGYGQPAKYQESWVRTSANNPGRPKTSSRTPLHMLEGTITPSGLHFERHHNGIPDIDPNKHELIIHGMVKRSIAFNLDTLMRYPKETHIRFLECSGNSGAFTGATPVQAVSGDLNGLLSCSEWTGVKLSTLLDEAGVDARAKWMIAEGGDADSMSRSVPMAIATDDAMIALYQNGEYLRPEQGFPMRLLLPGIEGNVNVKWLTRLKLVDKPANAKDETSKYTELLPDGKARQFMLVMQVKSAIMRPSFGFNMKDPGLYEIAGIAWSGNGKISKVEVSADGGKTWAQAALTEPVLSKAITRFRLPWKWDGKPSIVMSRATDSTGDVQPTRANWLRQFAPGQGYHNNSIQCWSVDADGTVKNVYV